MKYDKNDPATWNLKKDAEDKAEHEQPNKPNGAASKEVNDRQAIKNQSSVKPEDYPKDDGGKPNYKKDS